MKNEALLAVAGNGKTQMIAELCKNNPRRRLLVTFTTTGQEELRARIFRERADPLDPQPEVIGWYTFLIEHFLKPFYPEAYS